MKLTKSELKSMIREALREELSKRRLKESAMDSYNALMEVQRYIQNLEGWEIVDCDQDDDYSMALKCTTPYDIDEDIQDIIDICRGEGVDFSINSSTRDGYDVIIYLSYEDYENDDDE